MAHEYLLQKQIPQQQNDSYNNEVSATWQQTNTQANAVKPAKYSQ